MTAEARERMEARFNELTARHALGTATPEEEAKLDRYQDLRRIALNVPPPPLEELRWFHRQMRKRAGRMQWESQAEAATQTLK